MQLEIFILLLSSPFPYLLRLWGRRKVHNPPPPFLYALKSLVYPVSTPHFFPLSGKKEPFLSVTQEHMAQGKLPPCEWGTTPGFSCPLLLFSWCSFSWWAVGNRTAMGFVGPLTVFFFLFCL